MSNSAPSDQPEHHSRFRVVGHDLPLSDLPEDEPTQPLRNGVPLNGSFTPGVLSDESSGTWQSPRVQPRTAGPGNEAAEPAAPAEEEPDLDAIEATGMAEIASAPERRALGNTTDELAELVAAAIEGDPRATEDLLAYIAPRIRRYCRGRIGRYERSFTSADDVAQEVMFAVLKALPKYKERGRPFLAFVYGIAHNKVADAHRMSHRNRSDPYEDVPDSPDIGGGPEALALAGELQGRLGKMLDTLQKNQRDILLYRVVVGLSAEETAEAVGSTAGAVRVAQHRALAKLRQMLAAERDI